MKINSEAEMLEFGEFLGRHIVLPIVFELVGDVGAGKTTFTRGLAQGLGVAEAVTSPSFTISKRYIFNNTKLGGGELVHYDFYRLSDPGIMRDELAETLQAQNVAVVVEWGGEVEDLLPEGKARLDIVLNEDGSRTVNLGKNLQQVENLWKTRTKTVEKSVDKAEENS